MTVQLVRPSSLPYALAGAKLALYQSAFSIDATIPPTIAGDGSLSDDSDATGVTLKGVQNSSGGTDSTVIGVDFAPISGTVTGSFDTLFRLARVMTQADFGHPAYLGSQWIIIYGNTPTTGAGGNLDDAMPYVLPTEFNSIPAAQTTWETSDGQYAWTGGDPASIVANGFTLAFAVRITTDTATDIQDVFNVTEVGLYIDIASTGIYPLTRYPRAGVSGPNRARRRLTRRPGNY